MSVIKKEAYYPSNNGIDNIRALIWQDNSVETVGVVQIAHGVCEHIGRYDEFARFLAGIGFVVCGNDHLGHGKSVANASMLGIVDEGDHVNMLRDMNTLQRIMTKRFPSLPYILFGHSMGSFLARIYAAAFGETLSALILCGTGQLSPKVTLLDKNVDMLLGKLPPEGVSINILNDIFCKFTRRILNDSDDFAWISKSKTNLEEYRSDPLCGFKLSNSLARVLVTLAVKASDLTLPEKMPKNLPVLMISGAKDPIGFFGRGVLAVSDEFMKVGIMPDVYLYPSDRHEILHEDDRDKVFYDVKRFLTGIIDGTHAAF